MPVAHERGWGLQGEVFSVAEWANIHQEAEQRARNLLRAGENVIYDTTAFVKAERDALHKLALECGAQLILIYVQISRAEALRRWEANNQTRQRFLVHIDDFTMVADHFQPPLEDEPHLLYIAGADMAAWIQANIPLEKEQQNNV